MGEMLLASPISGAMPAGNRLASKSFARQDNAIRDARPVR
jgi:hypothetical protein